MPAHYQLPAAIVLLIGGIVACFFGYRLFRIVLAIFGFILGALVASSLVGASDTWPAVLAAVAGGLLGAAVMMAAYFVGVAMVGAGLGALIANVAFTAGDREPHFLVIVFASVVGAAVAIYLQRYVIIIGTAFAGAWTIIVGAMALVGNRTGMAAAASRDVWVMYPLDPAPDQRWVSIAWIVLGLTGVAVQMGFTGGEKGRVVRRPRKSKK